MMPIHFWSIGLRGSPSTSTEIFTLLEKVMQGHYVPQLSQLIYQRNKGVQNPVINFKGFLVIKRMLRKGCNSGSSQHPSVVCMRALRDAEVGMGNIDPYSIFTCPCNNTAALRRSLRCRYPWMSKAYDPCTKSDVVGNYWVDSPLSMLPIYQELIAAGLRIWVFSGDTDAVVLVNTTLYSINALKLPTLTKWYPWNDNGKVGGWSKAYKGLTFVTVTRAGHEVPLHFPRHAFVLFKSFLEKKA